MIPILQTTYLNPFSSIKLIRVGIKISVNVVFWGPIDYKPMVAYFTDAYMRYAA